MSEDNKAVIRHFVQAVNTNDRNAAAGAFAPDFVDHSPGPGQGQGLQGFLEFAGALMSAFHNMQITIDDLVAEGDKVVLRDTTRATHGGDFMGIPASGKPVSWTEMRLYRIKDGKIVEQWVEVDRAGLMQQMQSIPQPEQSSR